MATVAPMIGLMGMLIPMVFAIALLIALVMSYNLPEMLNPGASVTMVKTPAGRFTGTAGGISECKRDSGKEPGPARDEDNREARTDLIGHEHDR